MARTKRKEYEEIVEKRKNVDILKKGKSINFDALTKENFKIKNCQDISYSKSWLQETSIKDYLALKSLNPFP